MTLYDTLKAQIEQRGVHPELGGPGQHNWFIEQNPHELATFLVAMHNLGVQSILEIGTGWKAGLSRFLAQDLGWQVTSVDVKDYGHSFAGVEYIIGDDEDIPIDWRFDLVFIDGEHTYQAVRDDLAMYGARADKAVAFHDIAGLRACDVVAQYWQEIAYTKTGKLRRGYHEIIADSSQRAGIGWYEVHS